MNVRLLAFASLVTAAALASPAAAQGGLYELVWEDQFNGTTLDGSKWSPMTGGGGWGNNELQHYRAENATVSGGTLKITARRENFGGNQYTSARLHSPNLADFTYGRFEMRAKLPFGQGLWPAFWLLPTDWVYGGWAASGEMDVMEFLGQAPNQVFGTLHYGGQYPNNVYSGQNYTLPSGSFTEDFHTFAMEWEPTQIRWFVDDVLYSTQTSWWSASGPYPAPFNQRFHMLLNLAVGGNLPGSPNGSTPFPATYEVDYVKVYQATPHNPADCICVVDNMDHGNLGANSYFTFSGTGAGGGIGVNVNDLPPVLGGTASLETGWGNGGQPGFLGGFGRTRTIDASEATHFEMWIRPDAGQEFVLEINLQDDDNGDNRIPDSLDGADDEFQYDLVVGPAGSPVVSGGGWQKVSIPLTDFYDDNGYLTGGNGVLDLKSTAAGGNGQLINVVFALFTTSGDVVTFRTDQWSFVRRTSEIQGLVWNDSDSDGTRNGEPGIAGVTVELVNTELDTVVASDTTSAGGAYSFPNQVRGAFEVRVDTATLPPGLSPTFDPDGLASPGTSAVDLACDDIRDNQNFGWGPEQLGEKICSPAAINSTGDYGRLQASGTPSVASNDLALTASRLPAGSLGYFLVAPSSGFIPNPGGSFGNLCLSPPFGRYVQFAAPVAPDGTLGLTVDLSSLPQPTGSVAAQPGDTWYFQAWHRDGIVGLASSNFSEGLGITLE